MAFLLNEYTCVRRRERENKKRPRGKDELKANGKGAREKKLTYDHEDDLVYGKLYYKCHRYMDAHPYVFARV